MEGGIINEATLVPISMVITIVTVAVFVYSNREQAKRLEQRQNTFEDETKQAHLRFETRLLAVESEGKQVIDRLARIETEVKNVNATLIALLTKLEK